MATKQYGDHRSYELTDTLADAEPLSVEGCEIGSVYVPTGVTSVTLTFYASNEKEGTYVAQYDSANSAITQTVAAGRHAQLKSTAIDGRSWIKIIGNADDSANANIELYFE